MLEGQESNAAAANINCPALTIHPNQKDPLKMWK